MVAYETVSNLYVDFITLDANECVALGVNKNLDQLPDPSPEFADKVVKTGELLLEKIAECLSHETDFDRVLDLKIGRLHVESKMNKFTREINGHPEYRQLPVVGGSISQGLFDMLVVDPRSPSERLNNMLSRLKGVPEFCRLILKTLQRPIKRWVDIDIEVVQELPGLFETICNWAESVAFDKLGELRLVVQDAERALNRYLEQLQAIPVEVSFVLGERQAAEIIRMRGIEKSLPELHQMARRFLSNNKNELDKLSLLMIKKYHLKDGSTHKEVHDFLIEKFKVDVQSDAAESVLNYYHEWNQKIIEFIRSRNLFPILDNQSMNIIKTPDFMEPLIPAGAMMPPAPFREGMKTSMVYLTIKPDQLGDHNHLGIPTMMIHEGIPGHHLQLATSGCHPSVFRKAFPGNDLAEGWATMLEDFMLDQGIMGDLTDECRFITKREIARMGARVAIDLYFMTNNPEYLDVGLGIHYDSVDPFENAGKLLRAVTGFSEGRIQAELNWYSIERAYPLSYLTGNQLVWALKEDMTAALKEKRTSDEIDRLFHQTLLAAGNMPVAYLRRVFEHQGFI